MQLWSPAGASVISAPTIDEASDAVYVTTGNSYTDPAAKTSDSFIAMNMQTGKLLWSRQVTANDAFNEGCVYPDHANCPAANGPDYGFLASPVLVHLGGGKRLLIAGEKSGKVYAVDPDKQGEVAWQTQLGKGLTSWGSAADGQNLYVSYSGAKRVGRVLDPKAGGGLYALQLATGKRVWYTPPLACGAQPSCSPAQSAAITFIPGAVFSGSYDGHLRAFASGSGKMIWDVDTNGNFQAVNGVAAHGGAMDGPGPVVVGGSVYVNSGYGFTGGNAGNVLLAYSIDGK